MTPTPTPISLPSVAPVALAAVQDEVKTATATAIAEVGMLTITSQEGYHLADTFLSNIRATRRKVAEKLDPIIKPLRAGLDQLYAFRRELDGPLDTAESQIKGKMAAWDRAILVERQRQQAIIDEQERVERERIQREIREKRDAETRRLEMVAAEAKTVEEATTAANQAEAIATAPEPVISFLPSQTLPTRTRAANSSSRQVQKWRVVDRDALLEAVLLGMAPSDAVCVDSVAVGKHFKADPKAVAAWPGVEIYMDVEIAGRG